MCLSKLRYLYLSKERRRRKEEEGANIKENLPPSSSSCLLPPPPPIFYSMDVSVIVFISSCSYFTCEYGNGRPCGLPDSNTCGVTPPPPPHSPPPPAPPPALLEPMIFDIVWEDQRIEPLNPAGVFFFYQVGQRVGGGGGGYVNTEEFKCY